MDNNKSTITTPLATKKEQRAGAGDKLKESLLRVSREHYKYVKRSEALEKKVFELRSELETANQKIRDLKQELEEFRDGSCGELVSVRNSYIVLLIKLF